MFGNSILPHTITINKYVISKNEYGEETLTIDKKITTKAFVNSNRTRIVNEKYGIVEDIFFQALIPANVEVSKKDTIVWINKEFKIREILPVFDVYGNIIFQRILMELKE